MFTIQKALRRWDDAQIVVRSVVTGEQKVLVEGGADARYVPTGHLVYAQSGSLMAVPFDLERLAVTGSPNGIVAGVMQDVNSVLALGDSGAAQFSVSESGALAYLPGGIFPDAERSFMWVNRNGSVEPLTATGTFAHPRLSPDARRLAFYTTGTVRNVWIRDLTRGTSSRLIGEAPSSNAIWTSDGKRLTFSSATSGPLNLFWKPADGSGTSERLASHTYLQTPSSWSPDGKALAYVQGNGNDSDIWMLTFDGGAPNTRPFLQTPSYEQYPEFSPNGRWLAYGSNESGRPEVYVQPYPGPGGRQLVSIDGGEQPAWAHNGQELFYTVRGPNGTIKMMAVNVTTGGPVFTAGTIRPLFDGRYRTTLPVRDYDVTSDGQRFVMTQDKEQKGPPITEIILVQNWTEELKRLVPTK